MLYLSVNTDLFTRNIQAWSKLDIYHMGDMAWMLFDTGKDNRIRKQNQFSTMDYAYLHNVGSNCWMGSFQLKFNK